MPNRPVVPFRQKDDFYYERGQDALEQEDCLKANRYYRMVYDRDRQNEEACLFLAENYCCAGRYERALEILSVIPANGEFSPEFYFGMGNVLCFLDCPNEASDMLCRYLMRDRDGDYAFDAQEILEDLQAQLEMDTDEEAEMRIRVRHLYRLLLCGQTERAWEWVRLHRYMPEWHSFDFPDPEYPDWMADAVADVLVSAGEKGFKGSKRIDASILRKDPEHLHARIRSAYRALRSGNRDAAIRQLRAVKKPVMADERIRLADAWLHLGDAEASGVLLDSVLSEFPYCQEAAFLEADRLFSIGKAREGTDMLKMLLQLDPEDAGIRYYLERWREEWTGLPMERFFWFPVPPESYIRQANVLAKGLLEKRDAPDPERMRALLPLLSGKNFLALTSAVLSGRIEPLYADLRQQLLRERLSDSDKQEALELMSRAGFLPPYLVRIDGHLMRAVVYEEKL